MQVQTPFKLFSSLNTSAVREDDSLKIMKLFFCSLCRDCGGGGGCFFVVGFVFFSKMMHF